MAKSARTQLTPAEWRAGSSLASVYALRMLGMFLVLPVLALYAATLPDATHHPALIGLAMGIYGLTQALLQLPLGIASDRFGRKKIIYCGLLIFATGSFWAAAADTLSMLVCARALQGAGAVSAAVTALLADLTREEVRTRAMAMVGMSIGLTFAISLVAAPILASIIGVPGLFTLTGILTLISIIVIAKVTPNPATSRLHQDTEAQPSRIKEILSHPQLLRLNFGIFALHASQMALFTALPFALVSDGLAKAAHWQVYLPAVLTGLILMVPLIIIGETRGRLKQIFVLGIACIAIAQLLLLGNTSSIVWILSALIIYFIGFNVLEASLPSLVSKIAPSDLKGTAMGVYNTAQSLGLFTGGLVGGLLLQWSGTHAVFIFSLILITLWLWIAARAPAPKAVKNLAFALSPAWQGKEDALQLSLQQLSGVEAVTLSTDKQTIYIKAYQRGFDESEAQRIISGV